jgi:two-component system CheB/CheR fusion protein
LGNTAERSDEFLSRKLTEAEGYLKAVLDDYESATEELRSTQEALAFANQELQTLNSELTAANQELHRLNNELRSRNHEVEGARNELASMLRSAGVAIIVLGSDLRIRRFTNLAERLFRLREADLGRLLREVPAFALDGLEGASMDVLKTLRPRRFTAGSGVQPLTLWLRPYYTLEHRIDGIVILVLDGHHVVDGQHA